MTNELQVAFISGPAYDPLYDCVPRFEKSTGIKVSVGFRGDHPTLNRHLAELSEVSYRNGSTDTKPAREVNVASPVQETGERDLLGHHELCQVSVNTERRKR